MHKAPETEAVRNADTVKFFPSTIPLPQTSTEDYLKQASSDILSLLKNRPTSLPYLQAGSTTKNAIEKMAHLLNRAEPRPKGEIIEAINPASETRVQTSDNKNSTNEATVDVSPLRVQPSDTQNIIDEAIR